MRDHVQRGSACSVLSYRSDPIRRIQRRIRITWLGGAVVAVLCGLWAGRTIDSSGQADDASALNQPSPRPAQPPEPPEPIDRRVFEARLWNPPPAQATPEQPDRPVAKRPEPVRFQLIGIIDDGGPLQAALYDPQTDRLLIVRSGDRIKQHTITAVTADGVELSDGRSVSRLTLREKRS